MLLLILLFILGFKLFRWLLPRPPKTVLNVYFGVPGSGKTTFAAYLAKQSMRESRIITWARNHPGKFSSWLLDRTLLFKRSDPVYSNVPITGSYQLDPKDDIGKVMVEDGRVIIDEAAIEYNNRAYPSYSAATSPPSTASCVMVIVSFAVMTYESITLTPPMPLMTAAISAAGIAVHL